MIAAYPTVTASTTLLHDMAHVSLTLDAVYAIYAAIGVGVVGLWAIGVAAFGRPDSTRDAATTQMTERVTPVAP